MIRRLTKIIANNFGKFSTFNFLKITIADIVLKVFDKHRLVDYSISGEDRIIEHFFRDKNKKNLTYIDIGCNDPVFGSSTFKLYREGARGLCIDANENVIKKYKTRRPNDIAICACVSNQEKIVQFTVPKGSDFLGAIHSDNLPLSDKNYDCSIFSIQTVSGTTIIDKFGFSDHYSLLSIDVEGHDYEVLKSINLNKYSFDLIVIESHECMQLSDVLVSEITKFLSAHYYVPIYFATWNIYYKNCRPLS